MSYKNELNKEESFRWETFKQNIETNRKELVFSDAKSLGQCNVLISNIDGELFLEILPLETVDFDNDIDGIIVQIDENKVHLDSIMNMEYNAQDVEQAKYWGNPIKVFPKKAGSQIYPKALLEA